MNIFYNILVFIIGLSLKIVAIFNRKIRLFVDGRKGVFKKLENHFSEKDAVIWFHCASLGEFEQGRPIIEKVRLNYPNHKILVTFFSPSGYEIRKNYPIADVVIYLPIDTKKNARKFLKIVNLEVAIFIKYEFWPNFLKELKNNGIKTILVSGIFRKEQLFFKNYGGWMKNSLKSFNHFFVQNKSSAELLSSINLTNITISGDTRFDRVNAITKQEFNLEPVEHFVGDNTVLVAGSTWVKDEELIVAYINKYAESNQKFIIAPHNLKHKDIINLKGSISKEAVLFSEINDKDLNDYQVLIIDSIGLLSKIYFYADIAYVGGGFGTGIHNILEPATFGVPIIIGPNYQKFNEANELVKLGACKVISSSNEYNSELTTLFNNKTLCKSLGEVSRNYIIDNIGATDIILDYLNKTITKNK